MHVTASSPFGRIGPYLVVTPILATVLGILWKDVPADGVLGTMTGHSPAFSGPCSSA
jgi:hypothetical protein